MSTPLSMAMVGGGQDAFIGAVHRMAVRLDDQIRFVAGALSSTPERARASGDALGLRPDRNYPTWQTLIEQETKRSPEERVDLISIVTPNDSHYEIARACVDAGFHVVLDKPMVHSSQQAADLIAAVERAGTVFGVTYNYSGYPLVREARHLVQQGELGTIRKVIVEYNQGWLSTKLEASGQKQAGWRTDPARSGLGGAIGDIGSHAEQLLRFITGLEIESICADLTAFVPGRELDDDVGMLLRFTSGAKGVLVASQVCTGEENNLRIRAWGEQGGLDWRQEQPNELILRKADEPMRHLRPANPYVSPAAAAATRIPAGHPEAFIEAFANIYRGVADAIRACRGENPRDPELPFPDVHDGARGVQFIERAVESSRSDRKWTPARWDPGAE